MIEHSLYKEAVYAYGKLVELAYPWHTYGYSQSCDKLEAIEINARENNNVVLQTMLARISKATQWCNTLKIEVFKEATIPEPSDFYTWALHDDLACSKRIMKYVTQTF